MNFDPTTFCFATDDASPLTNEQLEAIARHSPSRISRKISQRLLSERRTHSLALAAYDRAYMPMRACVERTHAHDLPLGESDMHGLLFLCELGLRSLGIDPDQALAKAE